MSVNETSSCCRGPAQHRDQGTGSRNPLKRKLAPVTYRITAGFLSAPWSYPSPPMSSPPSPQQAVSSTVATTTNVTAGLDVTSGGPITTFGPALATTLPLTEPPLRASLFSQPPTPGPFGASSAGPATTFQQALVPNTAVSGEASVPAAAGPSTRGGRRSKTHVASACVNCKRAHLSCDVQRPCARCVASGKQDTCVDVQHKKRGRPRVREETEFRSEHVNPPQSFSQTPVAGPSQPSVRPIAGVRHRRGESFRSITSGTSEESPGYVVSTPRLAPPGPLQSSRDIQQPPTSGRLRPPFEIATALLNTDFAIVRANRPFESIMTGGADVRGRHISDLASTADNEPFLNIRNSLRAEWEARDPAYMPPIMQPGQDPVQGIPEADAEQYTQGFNDRTYTWRRKGYGVATETFPVRIRLAKASTYFVVVTLPSFQPVERPLLQSPAPMLSGPIATGPLLRRVQGYNPLRPPASQSVPPAPQPYTPNVTVPTETLFGSSRFSLSHTYPPSQPPPPLPPSTQQQPQEGFQPMVAERPAEITASIPRTGPIGSPWVAGSSARQLPPPGIGLPPTVPRSQDVDAPSSDGGEAEGSASSPRKRRRMGIDDVLQR